ncbi:DUF3558 family protein [Rhodococcoides yunnanense]|uniref:DUF3558 family protein n=1 Tax=Rhodococcoides yunnanense TaxID=278209 RepID=UPI0014728D16|nr:DUF3558 family protein [Rhodococcus yunnanensis]
MLKWMVVGCALVALVGGCSRHVDAVAKAEPTRWDPCSLTPESIAATGLDPSYRDVGWGEGIVVDDWARCSFKPPGVGAPYFLSVQSSLVHSFTEIQQDTRNIEGRAIEIGDRDAFQYRRVIGRSAVACSVGIDMQVGVVIFSVNYLEYVEGETDPCAIVVEHTTDLESALPAAAR